MHVGRNRIFIGNLPPSVNEEDIKQQFNPFGNVVSVEIKHRKENVNENISPVFAFVSIETDKNQLLECFDTIANYNWHGYYVKLELAKESFLERLKREREEAGTSVPTPKPITVKTEQNNITPSKITIATSPKKKLITKSTTSSCSSSSSDSSSSSSSDSEDEVKIPNGIKQNGDKTVDEIPGLIIKSNKNKSLTNGKLTIESVNSTPIHVITRKSGLQKDGQKITPADEKRLNSLYKLKESYNQQNSLIKNALSKIDTQNTKNKIVFDDDGKQQSNKRKQNFDQHDYNSNNNKKGRFSLFEDDEEHHHHDDINFEIKNQFEGKKGQRLLELQSKFTNDKRFTLDSRFVEDEDVDVNDEVLEDDEKQKQLEILESVIGKKITKIPNQKSIPRGMLRYDPTNVEHSKFEIKDKPAHINNKVQKEIVPEKVEEPAVEVSKEKFYKVTENLQQTFKESQGFSLLNMFGKTPEEDKREPENNQETTKVDKIKFGPNHNPFKYDSSDSEDENVNDDKVVVKKVRPNLFRPLSGEKFFFQSEDARLKDGVKFLKQFSGNSREENFTSTRREIKQIIRAKVRHVQRSNRPFRMKIGQHKHIKIKKAKKN